MSNKANVNSNALFNTIKSISGIIYPLITFPYISRVLRAENVGKINFGNSVVSYFSLLASLGVTTYAVRECSRVRENCEELNAIASQIFSINILSTLLAYFFLVITLIIARPLDDYRILICIQSTVIIFNTLGADWLNTAMEDFRYIAIRTVLMQILSLILMFAVVRKPEDYLIYAGICALALSGANIINIAYRKKICKAMFTLHIDLKKHLPPILLLFSMILSQTIYCNSDITMLGLIRNDYEVGLYSTCVSIYNIVNTVVASVAWVVMPQLTVGFGQKDYNKINELLKYSMNFIIVLGMPCLIGLNVIAKPLISVLAGNEYLEASMPLHILTVALAFSFIGGWIGNMIMLPSGRENICLRACIISALINVILNLFLIPKFGMTAAASTTVISECVGIVISHRYIDKEINIVNFKNMILSPITGSVAILLIGTIVKNCFHSPWAISVLTIFFGLIFYCSTLLIMKNEFFIEFIRPVTKKLKRR